jgi:gas vesicle protein
MSYAGKDPRSRRVTATAHRSAERRPLDRELTITARGIARPARPPVDVEPELDWQHIAIFAAGALIGVAVGAGAALLLAPQSGEQARHNLARQGRHLRTRTADAWDDLRHELRFATRRGRRKLARKLTRALKERRERRALRDEEVASD